jgi:hypothetical protein
MPVSEERFVACLDCYRGPKYKITGEDACAAGWKARRRSAGCYLGSRIVGTAAKKGEQGYVAPVTRAERTI